MALTAITKDFITRAGIIVQGTNAVTSSTQQLGAGQFNSGVGIAKNLIVGTTATVWGPTFLQSDLTVEGIGRFNANVAATTATAALYVTNGGGYINENLIVDSNLVGTTASSALSVTGGVYVGDNLMIAGTGNATDAQPALQIIDGGANIDEDVVIKGATLQGNQTGALVLTDGGAYINEGLILDSNVDTTGSTDGALVLTNGGAYINKSLYVDSTENSTSAGDGALVVAQGGAYVDQDVYINGTTAASSTGTGALVVAQGGAYINNVLWVNDSTDAATTPAGALVLANGGAYIKLKAIVDSADNTTGIGSGALQVNSGGAYINKDVYVDGTTAASTTSAALYVATGGGYIGGDLIVDGTTAGGTGAGALLVRSGGASVSGDVYIDSSTTANNAGSGTAALRVEGGAYIKDNLMVKSTAFDTGTNVNNALYVAGGAWIDKTLLVGGDTTFNGSVYFNGTATYVYSTNTVYTDNMIQLHVPPGGEPISGTWAADDGKDIGLVFHYYKGADQDAFLGFANDSSYLEWYDQGSENTSGVYVGTRYGTFKTGHIELVGATDSTSTATGTLIVDGGAGIHGDVWIGDELHVGGTLFVDKITSTGDLDATVTTATNIQYGLIGEIPIQTGPGQTSFIAAGTAVDQLLTWGTNTATWVTPGSITAGAASNVVGGAQYWIPFQDGPSITAFDSNGNFTYNSATTVFEVGDIAIHGLNAQGAGIDSSIQSYTGKSLEIYSNQAVQLNYTNTNLLTLDANGLQLTGTADATFDMNGTTKSIIKFNDVGTGAPTTSTYSDGSKLILWDNIGPSTTGYGLGIDTNTLWFGLDVYANTHMFKWYGGTVPIMTLTNELLTVAGGVTVLTETPTGTAATGGAVSVAGGVGITKDLYVGTTATIAGKLTVTETSPTGVASSGGAVSVDGGVGIAKDLYVNSTATFNGVVNIDNVASDHTALTPNALVVDGGVGINGGLFVNSSATIQQDLFVWGEIYMQGAGLNTITAATGTFDYVVIEGTGTGLTVWDDAWIQGSTVQLGSTGDNQLENLSSKSLEVRGGWGQNDGSLSLFAGNFPTSYSKIFLEGDKRITSEANTWTFRSAAGAAILATINATTASTSPQTGALVVNGGVGIEDDLWVGDELHVGGTVDFTNTTQAQGTGTDTGAVKIAGGLLVKKNIVAGGLVIGGDYMGGAVPTNPANQTVEAFKGSNNMQSGFTSGVISTNTEQNLDVFNANLYTTAKYIVQVKDGSNVHSSEILLIHDGTDAYLTEYAIITNNGELGTFGADLSGGNVTLKFVPTAATAMRINVIRTSILTSISQYAV